LEPNSELNVTALIDLGFALLIIFMISTPLIEKEQLMEISLPIADPADSTPSQPRKVDLLVTSDGYMIDSNPVGIADMEREMQLWSEASDPPVISIRADGDSPYQGVVTILDMMKRYKLSKFNLVTRPEEQ
jgi:biopolymer transport protein ExbD